MLWLDLISFIDGSKSVRDFIASNIHCDEGRCLLIDVGAAGDFHFRWEVLRESFSLFRFDPSFSQPITKNNVATFPFAIASRKGNSSLFRAKKAETSSFFSPNFEFLRRFQNWQRFEVEEELMVETRRLSEFLNGQYWFSKIDVQGSELEVLMSADSEVERMIGTEIEIEFSEVYSHQPLAAEILTKCQEAGLEVQDFLSYQRWSNAGPNSSGQLIFADILFLRPPEWVMSQEDDHAIHLYLAICLAYRRIDAIRALLPHLENQGTDTKGLKRVLKSLELRRDIELAVWRFLQAALRPIFGRFMLVGLR